MCFFNPFVCPGCFDGRLHDKTFPSYAFSNTTSPELWFGTQGIAPSARRGYYTSV